MGCLADYGQTVLYLKELYELKLLIETGTYMAESAIWGAAHFADVVTLEKNLDFAKEADIRTLPYENILVLCGDSRISLSHILSMYTTPALFWLDAHNESALFGDGADDCPLMEELGAIFTSERRTPILIDDAKMFKPPRDPKVFPRKERIEALAADNGFVLRESRDAFLLIPRQDQDILKGTEWQ